MTDENITVLMESSSQCPPTRADSVPQPRCATRVLFAIPMPSDLTGNLNCKLNFKSSSSPVKGSRTGKSGRRGELGWLPGREERAGIPGGAAAVCSHRDPGDPRHPKAAENLSSWRMFIASKSSCHWDTWVCLPSLALCVSSLLVCAAEPCRKEQPNPLFLWKGKGIIPIPNQTDLKGSLVSGSGSDNPHQQQRMAPPGRPAAA